ncbi:hypothetical protein [Streptomyces sp. SBT349]|uniref:hypothetical protein n=1 Tax=Streptomyces sp. SBT349 TaxID=1580539 RepID=UPI000B145430|nr:hypothetical protein [Streptomyces sp. SBT349]
MSATQTLRTGRARRTGQRTYGALLVARMGFLGLLVLLLVAAGAWSSFDTARHAVIGDGRERSTVTLAACDRDACTGPLDSTGETVVLRQVIARDEGERLAVAVVPGTGEVVRTGLAGALYACLPLTGALLMAAVVIGGGLRMYRTAWATAGVGLAALVATFTLWI